MEGVIQMSKLNVTEIDAFVRDEFLPEVESQIIANNALLARLEGMGKYVADSGEHIRTGARYARLPGGMYKRGTKFSTVQKETVKEYIHDYENWPCKTELYAGNSLEPLLLTA